MCLGIPGQIIRIEDADDLVATVDVLGVKRRINIACIVDDRHPAEACVGDWVLVHVGFAMSRIDEREAQETLRLLEELAQMQDEMRMFAETPEAAA
jgi:hydrogenase expression/formation protein HypC